MTKLKVGLEIHVYPLMENKSKLFCNCAIEPNSEANSNICEICTSQPGAHPMKPNREAILKALIISNILGCKIEEEPAFQRKHYSWPDLPSGYQRTMSGAYANPTSKEGLFKDIRIKQVHLEEDPARWDPDTGIIDYNRCGTPLVEIVTEPDFKDKEEVRQWLEQLKLHLDHAGCFDERFGIKADVNVSIEPAYDRVEIKNINSFSSITESIDYEYERQKKEVELGKKIILETRTWTGSETVSMRTKEESSDYRFIPEQDLPLIKLNSEILNEAKKYESLDITQMKKDLITKAMTEEDAEVIIQNPVLYNHVKYAMEKGINASTAGRFIRRELLRVTNYKNEHPRNFKGSSRSIINTINLFEQNKISDKIMRGIMERLYQEDFDVPNYVEENNLLSVSDEGALEKAADEIISANGKAVEDYRNGKIETINFLSGQVMRLMKGKADIKKTQEILKRKLQE